MKSEEARDGGRLDPGAVAVVYEWARRSLLQLEASGDSLDDGAVALKLALERLSGPLKSHGEVVT